MILRKSCNTRQQKKVYALSIALIHHTFVKGIIQKNGQSSRRSKSLRMCQIFCERKSIICHLHFQNGLHLKKKKKKKMIPFLLCFAPSQKTGCILQTNKSTVGTELYPLLLKISSTIQLTVSLKRSNMLSSVCVQKRKTGYRKLITQLNRLGHSISYYDVNFVETHIAE